MSLTIKDTGGNFVLAAQGLHIARCYALIDMGEQLNKSYNNNSPKVLIGWELPDSLTEDGKPFIHMQRYTASLNEKSNLRALLEAWRGKSFTEEELKGFKLKKILSQPCYITINHTTDPQTKKHWANVVSISKLPLGVNCKLPINPPIHFDLDEYSEAAYMAVPEGIRKKINLTGVAHLPPAQQTTHTPPMARRSLSMPLGVHPQTHQAIDDLTQDIPF